MATIIGGSPVEEDDKDGAEERGPGRRRE